MIYPDFIEIVREVCGMHTVGINTNLSLGVNEIIDSLDSTRVDLTVSFHPHFMKVEEMLDKLNLLKRYNWPVQVMFVGWPPHIPLLEDFYSHFKEFRFSVLPFWGKYEDKAYPQDYTTKEKDAINRYIAHQWDESFRTEPIRVQGRLCRAGQVYAHIEPDGKVLRCSAAGEPLIRNFYDENFSLLDGPSPCSAEFCRCLEYVVC